MISKTWRGYEVSAPIKGSRFKKYVRWVRAGYVYWTLDYTYAAHYSEKTALKHDANIKAGLYKEV